MPLAQPLAELRQNLEAQIRENQLPEALNALLAQLPEGSETQRIVSALIARLNAANKERYRDTISLEDYSRLVSQVRADFFDLIAGLKEEDFLPTLPAGALAEEGKKTSKLGSVLYRVPNTMPLQKPTRCTIRVAVDEDAILENIVLDEHVEMKSRVEISDVMRAELVDPSGDVFKISPLNAPNQLVRDAGYTEWNFSVTPLREGVHQLLVKVSIMEIVPGYPEPIPRDVSVMETVTIVTEGDLPSSTPAHQGSAGGKVTAGKPGSAQSEASAKAGEFKPSGQSFAFQSTATAQGEFEISYSKGVSAPSPSPSKSGGMSSGARALALFLAFLVLIPAGTWAIAPEIPAWVNTRYIQDSPEAYTEFIEKFPESPRREKAYFYKAETSGQLADLRVYQQQFPEGQFEAKVVDKIGALEIKAVQRIRAQPDAQNIRQFVSNFPESERLPEIKQAVEDRAELRVALLPVLEEAYVTSVQAKPTESKVTAYLRDFPKRERLNEVAEAVASKPEVMAKARQAMDEAITQKVQVATTADQVRQVLPALESAGSSSTATKVEKLVEQKPLIRQQLRQQVRESSERVRVREKLGRDLKSTPDSKKNSQLPESSIPKESGSEN